jgi:hypothetical protein
MFKIAGHVMVAGFTTPVYEAQSGFLPEMIKPIPWETAERQWRRQRKTLVSPKLQAGSFWNFMHSSLRPSSRLVNLLDLT